ncbi:MAG TPA: anthranilate phosphoribosyltransferase [candidate division Zixibacteria bacterium]|nr:anthranilate phosphoribosyltransferase [candidate division Zixibacteria bacterium]
MFKVFLQKVMAGENLTFSEAGQAMEEIMSGAAPAVPIAAFATALRLRGETVEELAGFVTAMRQRAVKLSVSDPTAIDTCGTGGDGAGTFNISSVAALIAAGAGATVVKHGGRGVSSACGSADVFAELGVKIDASPEAVGRCVEETGIGFCFAPVFHPGMKAAAPMRQELGFRTFFNLLGPLSNPAGVKRQLLGVFHPSWAEKLVAVLQLLGGEHILSFSNRGGMDELSFDLPSHAVELSNGAVRNYVLETSGWGYPKAGFRELSGGAPVENAGIIRAILQGEKGPRRDAAILNAAAALYVAGKAASIREGLPFAKEAIDSGKALRKLESLIEVSRK